MQEKPNLVLGMAQRLEWDDLRPFVESLRRSSFDGDVWLFVRSVRPETIAALESNGVNVRKVRHVHAALRWGGRRRVVHPYVRHLRRLQPIYAHVVAGLSLPRRDRLLSRARMLAPISVPHVARYLLFYDFLVGAGPRWANVLLTDTRDVYFQRDPFAFDIGGTVHCFLEEPPHTIGSCEFNTRWVRQAYGDERLAELADRRISCSGVTIGSYDAVLRYLRTIVDELVRLPRQLDGIDQAVHNKVLHTGRLPDARLVENGEGPVLTLGKMRLVTPGHLADGHGMPFNVVHQYDRHPAIAEHVAEALAEAPANRPADRRSTLSPVSGDQAEPIA